MEMSEIRKHWDSLARIHGFDLKSTTKTPTIKRLEIDALARVMSKYFSPSTNRSVLEVGCGNGHNIFGLAKIFPSYSFLGLDYSDDMILSASKLIKELPEFQLRFEVGDVLNLSASHDLNHEFDLVFTDRLLINLNTWELQKLGLQELRSCLKKNGYLVIIENFVTSYSNQNALRELIGLPPRTPDSYNRFMLEADFESFVTNQLGLEILEIDNFGSLHDLLLYVLVPHISNGKTMYEHPIMESITELLEKLPEQLRHGLGNFGQNKLYLLQAK